jgi:glutathione S-transferase
MFLLQFVNKIKARNLYRTIQARTIRLQPSIKGKDYGKMSSQLEPMTVWGQDGPNPSKVRILLEELGLPYKLIPVPFSDVKKPEYLAINPNGRIPSILDPNTGITIWESGAIVEYLIDRYDTKHQFSFTPGTLESYNAKQWLFFQTTGQGPYFGQYTWFKKYHAEKIPSAIERYVKEVNRVSGMLDGYLALQEKEHVGSPGYDGPWLVGNKLSYADLAFISWQRILPLVMEKDEYDENNFSYLKKWLDNMSSRESVKIGIWNPPS